MFVLSLEPLFDVFWVQRFIGLHLLVVFLFTFIILASMFLSVYFFSLPHCSFSLFCFLDLIYFHILVRFSFPLLASSLLQLHIHYLYSPRHHLHPLIFSLLFSFLTSPFSYSPFYLRFTSCLFLSSLLHLLSPSLFISHILFLFSPFTFYFHFNSSPFSSSLLHFAFSSRFLQLPSSILVSSLPFPITKRYYSEQLLRSLIYSCHMLGLQFHMKNYSQVRLMLHSILTSFSGLGRPHFYRLCQSPAVF